MMTSMFSVIKGSDYMSGDGADTYNIQNRVGDDRIFNGVSDEKLDTNIFPANADSISAHRSANNIVVISGSYRLTIENWFSGKSYSYQHVTLYSQDHIFLKIRHDTKTDRINLIPTLKELTSCTGYKSRPSFKCHLEAGYLST